VNISTYLDLVSLCSLRAASSYFCRLVLAHDGTIWRPHCSNQPLCTPPVCGAVLSSRDRACREALCWQQDLEAMISPTSPMLRLHKAASPETLKTCLGLSSFLELRQVLACLGTPCLGLFCHAPRMPQDFAADYRGAPTFTRDKRASVSLTAVDGLGRDVGQSRTSGRRGGLDPAERSLARDPRSRHSLCSKCQ
jgi:hypothetical protein